MQEKNGVLGEGLMSMAFNSAPSGIAVVNTSGHIVFINEQYCKIINQSKEKAIGMKLTDLVDYSLIDHVLTTGERIAKLIKDKHQESAVLEEKPLIDKHGGGVVGAISYLISKNNRGVKMLIDQLGTLEEEVNYYKERLASKELGNSNFQHFISDNKQLLDTIELAKRAAVFDANVLISGETGTGKELLALAIHQESRRRKNPFIKVNCAAIPANLLESELFGYESGAFTGARGDGKPGKFELADNGTIFLDEIGDMPLEMQAKILRVIQEREIERVGGTKTIKVNVRIISATNKDLAEMVRLGTFREDLYYRLLVIGLFLPPLRERVEDLSYIINNILIRLALRYEISKPDVTDRALVVMKKYKWPGNIRELENVLERALNLASNGIIDANHLPEKLLAQTGTKVSIQVKPLAELIEQKEKEIIFEILDYTNNNKQKAAELLGLSRTALYKKLEKFNKN